MALLNSSIFRKKIKADLKIISFLDLARSFVENYENIVSQTDTDKKIVVFMDRISNFTKISKNV